jgi:hypothetical protein
LAFRPLLRQTEDDDVVSPPKHILFANRLPAARKPDRNSPGQRL